jgi:hypothetical protein
MLGFIGITIRLCGLDCVQRLLFKDAALGADCLREHSKIPHFKVGIN